MRFGLLGRIARDDATIKFVFDHLRNLTIIALVLAMSAWKFRHIGWGWGSLFSISAATVLMVCGAGLLFFNFEHLLRHLKQSKFPKTLMIFFAVIYTVLVGELIAYLQGKNL